MGVCSRSMAGHGFPRGRRPDGAAHGCSRLLEQAFGRSEQMASENHIRNPLEWGWDQVKLANHAVGEAGRSLRRSEAYRYAAQPAVRRIEPADLKQVLALGLRDFG